MSFFYGVLFGISFGVVLIVAFARYEKIRSRNRSELAKIVAAFARMTVQDSRKVIPPEFYPPWVVFSQRQKAASELIRSNVEPILEQYRPAILASLTFSKLTLGTVARQFTGIAIVESESEDQGITMELECSGMITPILYLIFEPELVWDYLYRQLLPLCTLLHDTLNPVWNQTFDFVVEDGQHEMLILEVYDHGSFGKDKLGRCIMTLTRVMIESEIQDLFY